MSNKTVSKKLAERELILGCARTSIETPMQGRIRHLAGQELDWVYVLEVCHRHGIGPLLYRSLITLGQHGAPQSVMKQLQDHFYRNMAHNLRLEAELAALLCHFQKHGIQAIPYKGPALAATVYGDLALRVFGDLDILIQKEDIHRALELMISIEYQPDFEFNPRQMAAYVRTFYELPFTGSGKAPIGLHWDIYADHFAFPVAPLSIWDDEAEDRCESVYRSIPPEKLLLMLCVHGTQHHWGRLAWICDVAEILRRSNRLDWESLADLAKETGGLRMLYLGLHLAHELLEAPLPEGVLRRMDRDSAVAKGATVIRERIFGRIDGNEGVLETCLFYIRMRERLQDKVRFLFRTFSRPIPGEWDQLGHDDFSARLTNVIRHVQMAVSYGVGPARQRLRNR